MSCTSDQFDRVCAQQLTRIDAKLDRLDEALRGNGKPGLNVRVDRLEQIEAKRKRLTWIVVGAFASAGGSFLLQLGQMIFGA